MNDLELAKQTLKHNKLSLVIVKNGAVIFETRMHGVAGFLQAIEKLGSLLHGASVADKIVGRAAAMLCLHSRVESVFALVMSEKAKALLESKGVHYEAKTLVSRVMGKDGRTDCPFERLVSEIDDPKEAYAKLKACGLKPEN